MRLFILSLLFLFMPGTALARCVPFDFLESVRRIPYIVHGKVIASNKDELASARCGPAPCEHRFGIEVLEVLKGRTEARQLQFGYGYVQQRPEIDLFGNGDEYLFAISAIAKDGSAKLLGTTCGRSGLGVDRLDDVRKALRRP